jgi:hypothetical protein
MKVLLQMLFIPLVIASATASAQTRPEPPSIWREVSGAVYTNPSTTVVSQKKPVHTRPHVPSFRTSRDGRIGLRVLTNGDFTLLMPEKLTAPVRLTESALEQNSYVMSKEGYVTEIQVNTAPAGSPPVWTPTPANGELYLNLPAGKTGSSGAHYALFDPTPEDPVGGEKTNPMNIGGEDVYDLKVLVGYAYDDTEANGIYRDSIQIFSTPVRIYVSNPKTTAAFIRRIERPEAPTAGAVYNNPNTCVTSGGAVKELNIAGDGRLIVMRISRAGLAWKDPVSGVSHPEKNFDIVYSYYTPQQGAPCDPTKWTTLIPISHAPFDSRINTNKKFGFAMNPFRDPEGTPIADGEDIGGTYPWIDRDAKNIFFTTVSDTLRYRTGSGTNTQYTSSRYEQGPTAGELVDNSAEETSATRGICFAGLWSNGKIVMIDNLNNDMDYAIGNNLYSRQVRLFDTSMLEQPLPPLMSEWLKMGGGRVNSNPDMPPGDNRNSTIIESLENIFNYRKFANPISVRDVVWPLHNAKHSDDLVFDDYVDHNALIVANMSGLVTFRKATDPTDANSFQHHSGWNSTTNQFSGEVRLQNAATSTSLKVPAHGRVRNDNSSSKGRLEPAATGGIHGKGFWMDGAVGIEFDVPTGQPSGYASKEWYVGMFVDCRFNNDSVARTLFTFPDETAIVITGRSQISYYTASSTTPIQNISVPPALLPDFGWAHLAWQIRRGGRDIEFLLNGMTYHRFSRAATASPLFRMTPGSVFTAGQSQPILNPGFTGWIDNLLVLAHTVDPETACNHAGGTLVGLPADHTGALMTFANRFPASTHTAITNRLINSGETSYPKYANFYNYTKDYGAHLGNIPAGAVSLRQAIHFPEGPIFQNAPRPDSTQNSFCLQCHSSDRKPGLDLAALELNSSLTARLDPRRQPSQPFRRVFGNIPARLVDFTGQPMTSQVVGTSGRYIDIWMQPSFTSAAVKSFTLVDATNNVDLTTLVDGQTVNLATYTAPSYAIRANLDFAQGNVTLRFDSETSVDRDRIPYSITPVNLTTGPHSITATPQLGGVAVTVTFTVQ